MRKGIKKQFWLSEKDAADLKRKAKKCGITETAVIRQLLHGYAPREKPEVLSCMTGLENLKPLAVIKKTAFEKTIKEYMLVASRTPSMTGRYCSRQSLSL
jgi:hypothetical protein